MKRMAKFLSITLICFVPMIVWSNTFSMYAENDIISKEDGWYTHGSSMRYEDNSGWGLIAQQLIYTPENKGSYGPQYNDRPYSGLLTLGLFKNIPSNWSDDYIELDLGCVGPDSGAEYAQTEIHKLLNNMLPHGWKYQIGNMPVATLTYYKSVTHKISEYLEYKPFAGVDVGDYLDDIVLGNVVRFGINIPKQFNPFINYRSNNLNKKWYAYSFAGVSGQCKFYDTSLQGRMFYRDQVTIDDPNRFVATGYLGGSVGLYGVAVTITHFEKSDEWVGQPRANRYDGVQLSYSW